MNPGCRASNTQVILLLTRCQVPAFVAIHWYSTPISELPNLPSSGWTSLARAFVIVPAGLVWPRTVAAQWQHSEHSPPLCGDWTSHAWCACTLPATAPLHPLPRCLPADGASVAGSLAQQRTDFAYTTQSRLGWWWRRLRSGPTHAAFRHRARPPMPARDKRAGDACTALVHQRLWQAAGPRSSSYRRFPWGSHQPPGRPNPAVLRVTPGATPVPPPRGLKLGAAAPGRPRPLPPVSTATPPSRPRAARCVEPCAQARLRASMHAAGASDTAQPECAEVCVPGSSSAWPMRARVPSASGS